MTRWSDEDRRTYEREGFVVLRNVLDHGIIDAIRAEYEALLAAPPAATGDTPGPRIVFWRHVEGGRKRDAPLDAARSVASLIRGPTLVDVVHTLVGDLDLRLFECVVFDKPRTESTVLPWHQDCSFYPFEPANQLSLWMPLDRCTVASGAVHFAVGSHLSGRHAAVDLQSGARRTGDSRPEYADPRKLGYEVRAAEMEVGDLVAFDVRTWHCSPPNTSQQAHRRGLAVRFLVGPTTYAPTPGNAAGFISQIRQAPGQIIEGPAFPRVGGRHP